MLVPLWEGTKALRGNESVWDIGCVYKWPGWSWLVSLGSPNGHRFWGLRVSGLFEKDLWSRIKVIYLRTPDRRPQGLVKRGRGEIQRVRGGKWGGYRGSQGEKRRRRIMCNECVPLPELLWNVTKWPTFCEAGPCLEGWQETLCIGSKKCTACLDMWITSPLINLFKKERLAWK